jgi:hypothetical protein
MNKDALSILSVEKPEPTRVTTPEPYSGLRVSIFSESLLFFLETSNSRQHLYFD